jgi:hypothetical protein
MLMEQQEWLRRGLTPKVVKVSPIRIPSGQRSDSIAH